MTDKSLAVRSHKAKPKTHDDALMAFIARAATDQSIDITKLERLLEMQQALADKRAEAAYSAAMAKFKAAPVTIAKNKHVRYQTDKGVTQYDHATLDEVCRSINPALSAAGLSYRWLTEQNNGHVKVTCIVSHADGHAERTTLAAAPDDSGRKNSIQAIGSACTYLQRYTLLAALGVATGESDDDGAAADAQKKITESQVADLKAKLEEVQGNRENFLAYIGVDKFENILAANYDSVVKTISAKRGRR